MHSNVDHDSKAAVVHDYFIDIAATRGFLLLGRLPTLQVQRMKRRRPLTGEYHSLLAFRRALVWVAIIVEIGWLHSE